MNTIHKQPLRIISEQEVEMHWVATILTVQLQEGEPHIWYKTPNNVTEECLCKRRIFVVGTGCEVPAPARRHIGTIQQDGFVWHFFEGDSNWKGRRT